MDFFGYVDRAEELLRRHGKVSSRAIAREFGVDDAIAHDIENFPSGNGISVVPLVDMGQQSGPPLLTSGVPPISAATIAIVAIRAVDALSATVTTSDGRTLSTTDGGATWAPSQEKPAAPF